MNDLHSDSLQSVQSGYHSNADSPAMLGATDPTILNKILGTPCFLDTEREKDTVQFKQWYHAISDAQKNFNEQLVRAAITKSCIGDVTDTMCCLPPGATLDDILEKFKWLYGSVELQNAEKNSGENTILQNCGKHSRWQEDLIMIR